MWWVMMVAESEVKMTGSSDGGSPYRATSIAVAPWLGVPTKLAQASATAAATELSVPSFMIVSLPCVVVRLSVRRSGDIGAPST